MIASTANIVFREEDHTYWKDGVQVPGFHEVLSYMLPEDNYYKNPSYYAWRGRSVHHATAIIDQNDPDGIGVDPEVKPFIGSYYEFLKDHETAWLMIEQVLYHPTLRYCGTLDRYGLLDGNPCILDIKCGVPRNDITALQLCAYGMCIPEILDRWCVLYLSDKGTYKLMNLYDPGLSGVWRGIMTFYWWRKRCKK